MNRVSTTAPRRQASQAQLIAGIGKILGNMTVPRRDEIMTEALRHVGNCGEHEISRLVSKNLKISERVVDAVIILSYLEERSRRAAMESGILGAVAASREAGRDVWQEVRGVA